VKLSSLDVPTLKAAAWALRATRVAEREIAEKGLDPISLPPVPNVPEHAVRGVRSVLRRRGSKCLTRALVLQAWFAARGEKRDLIVSVTAPKKGFQAHAWLEGDPPCHEGFVELTRRAAP
jgi:hypothetical protein